MTARPPTRWPIGLVLLLLLFQLGVSAWWLSQDQYPSGYEVCEHLLYTRRMANEFSGALDAPDRSAALQAWLGANRRVGGRTTLLHMTLAIPMALLPGDAIGPLSFALGALSLTVLAASCYSLGAHLAGPWTGATAAALVLLAPPIWGFARRFGTDLPLTAGVALFALVLCRWPPWGNWRRALATGLLAGLLCLIKNAFVLWAGVLLLPALLLAWKAEVPRARIARQLLLIGVGFAIGTAFFWWGAWNELRHYIDFHVASGNPHSAITERWSLAAIAFYPTGSWRWLGLPLSATLVAGLGWAAMRSQRKLTLLWGWVLLGYLVFTLIGTKWLRYILPALPALCILAAVGYSKMHRLVSLPLLLAGIAVSSWLSVVGSIGPPPSWTTLDPELCYPPVRSGWADVASQIDRQLGPIRPRVIALIGPESWHGDDYSRMELHLLRYFPLTEVYRASRSRIAGEARDFEAAAGRFEMEVRISDPELPAPPPQLPGNWIELGVWPMTPATQPSPGIPPGTPLEVRLRIKKSLLGPVRNR